MSRAQIHILHNQYTYDASAEYRAQLKMIGQIGGQGKVKPSAEEVQVHKAKLKLGYNLKDSDTMLVRKINLEKQFN